jgi:hypothetical protein
MKKHADSIDAAILDRIRSGPQDYVWTPQNFLDLGSRAAVDKALSGPSRRIRSGKSEIVLRHVSPRFVATKNPKSAHVILALRWIGKRAVDDDVISRLRRHLSPADRAALPGDAACAPAWIADIFHRIAKDPPAAGNGILPESSTDP